MKFRVLFLLYILAPTLYSQPPLIHSHNDYQQTEPLTRALRNQAYSIEADVYLVNGQLLVAHDTSELSTAPTLDDVYLKPISDLFCQHRNRISRNRKYAPILTIDIKKNGSAVLDVLIKKLSANPTVFDRTRNKRAIQVMISGDRGSPVTWSTHPSYILFDGRPSESYDHLTLQRTGMISDSYGNYSKLKDSMDIKIKELAQSVHRQGKLLRLWAIPDHAASWDHLRGLGVDIINTDKVEECREYFGK